MTNPIFNYISELNLQCHMLHLTLFQSYISFKYAYLLEDFAQMSSSFSFHGYKQCFVSSSLKGKQNEFHLFLVSFQ